MTTHTHTIRLLGKVVRQRTAQKRKGNIVAVQNLDAAIRKLKEMIRNEQKTNIK